MGSIGIEARNLHASVFKEPRRRLMVVVHMGDFMSIGGKKCLVMQGVEEVRPDAQLFGARGGA